MKGPLFDFLTLKSGRESHISMMELSSRDAKLSLLGMGLAELFLVIASEHRKETSPKK